MAVRVSRRRRSLKVKARRGIPSQPVHKPLTYSTKAPTARKKMEIYLNRTQSKLVVPWAPRETTYSDLNGTWEEKGKKFVRGRAPRPKMSFTIILGSKTTMDAELTNQVLLLKNYARAKRPVHVSYSRLEGGLWRITSLEVRSIARHSTSGAVSRAEVDIEFTSVSGFGTFTGPLTNKHKKKSKKKGKRKKKGKGRIYVVKKGDTLSEIAERFYHNSHKWPQIAKANGVKNPRLLQIGKRLRIP